MKLRTNPELGLLVLVVVGCVDEVAALVVEEVENFEHLFLGHCAHHVAPTDGDVSIGLLHTKMSADLALLEMFSLFSGDPVILRILEY